MGLDEFDDDPTVVEDPSVVEFLGEDTKPYAEHGLYHRGVVDAFAAMRLALLSVGVEPHEVEPILDRVRKFMGKGNG